MKKILRELIIIIIYIFLWPILLYKKEGYKDDEIKNTILIANHYSNFDPLFIYLIYRKSNIVFVTHTGLKKKPIRHFICFIFDCIYIDYDANCIGFVRESIEILKKGKNICIFPEGAINPTKYGLFDFSRSYTLIARSAKANIIPIYIYPTLKPFKNNYINIGKTVSYNEYKDYSKVELNEYFYDKIMDMMVKYLEENNKLEV